MKGEFFDARCVIGSSNERTSFASDFPSLVIVSSDGVLEVTQLSRRCAGWSAGMHAGEGWECWVCRLSDAIIVVVVLWQGIETLILVDVIG